MSGFVTPSAFVIQFIILLLVLWVLKKFIFVPYLAYLDKWEDKQKKLEDDYKNIDALVAWAEEERKTMLKDARKKSEEMISEAEVIAKNKKTTIVEKAEKEALDIVESWRKEVEKEKLSMLSDVKWNIVDLVLKFNKKLFGKESVSAEFVAKEIELMK